MWEGRALPAERAEAERLMLRERKYEYEVGTQAPGRAGAADAGGYDPAAYQ